MATDSESRRDQIGTGSRRQAGSPTRPGWLTALGLSSTALVGALVATALTNTGSIPGLVDSPLPVRYGLPAVRVLLDIAAMATVGLSILPRLIGANGTTRAEPALAAARLATVLTSTVWTVSALLFLALRTTELNPDRMVTVDMVISYVATVPAGTGMLLTAVAGLVCVGLAVVAARRRAPALADSLAVVATLGLLPIPLTGHASHWKPHDLGLLAIELHVIGAALWAGGLLAVALFVAPRRGLLASTLPRFSRLATVALGIVGTSGVLNAVIGLGGTPGVGLAGLVTTGYGRIVLVKAGCLLLVAALAGYVRFRLLPRIVQHQRTALLRWLTWELCLLGLTYGLGVALAHSPIGG